MVKFKVCRLTDINQVEATLNDFDLGEIIDYQLAAPDYRIIIVVIRYEDDPAANEPKEPEVKDDKPAK